MAAVSSLGVGSGMDLQGLLTSLMQVERLPLQNLQKQASSYNSKISAMGTLSSQLGALQSALKDMMPKTLQTASQKFASYTGSLSNKDIGSVTIGDGATSGSYNLNVTSLATAQKLRSGAITDQQISDLSNTQLTITSGFGDNERSATVTITPEMDTVEKLRDAINMKTKDTGVSASVINEGNGNKRLVLTGEKEGSDQGFTLNSSDAGMGFLTSGGFETLQAASDAQLTLDGIAITSKGNTVSEMLEGVTLTLTQTGATQLKVTRDDVTNVKSAMDKFVTAFNNVARTINSLGAYDAETKTAGALNGNRILRESQSMMRSFVFDFQSATGLKLSDIGITFDGSSSGTNNTLTLDADKLANAIAKDPNGIAEMAAKLGKDFSDKIDKVTGLGGSLQIATDGMKASVRDLEKRQDAMNLRLTAVEERYRKQFTSLDTLLAQMNSTSTYLAQQLSSIANITNSKK